MTEFSNFIVYSRLNTIFAYVANYILGSLLLKVSEGRPMLKKTHKIIGMILVLILVLLLIKNKATCKLSRFYLEYRTRSSFLIDNFSNL